MRVTPAALLSVIALTLLPGVAAAQWKWRDASGQINASDRPPPKDVAEKDILSRPLSNQRRASAPAPAASASDAPVVAATPANQTKTPLEREVEARRRAAEQETAAKNRADEERLAQQRAENCRRARGHIAALESGQRMARMNEKGEREVLDDKMRAEEMRSARDVVASDCK
jgi:hypothetical protein